MLYFTKVGCYEVVSFVLHDFQFALFGTAYHNFTVSDSDIDEPYTRWPVIVDYRVDAKSNIKVVF